MRNKKTSNLALLSMFFATVIVIGVLNQLFLAYWPFLIKPTFVHIPVIIASIVLGPKLGALVGGFWGIDSVITATLTAGPTNFLFSPFQPVLNTHSGDWRALLIAIIPRILVGILPYFVYKALDKNLPQRASLAIGGLVGSFTNTVFVLGAIFIIFGSVLGWSMQQVLTMIVATNSIAEAILALLFTSVITPILLKLYQK